MARLQALIYKLLYPRQVTDMSMEEIHKLVYEVESKIFWTGAAIYTAVVVARAPVPTGQTVNSGFYCDVLRRLRENVRRRRPRTLARTDVAASP
jgi:hypothetical protein